MKTLFGRALTGALLGVYAVGGAGCEKQTCTGIGCTEPVEIYVTAEAWLVGDYTVGVSTPERAFTCNLPVPVLDSEGSVAAGGESAVWGLPADCTQTAGTAAEQWETPDIYFDRGFRIHLLWATSELELTLHYEGQTLLEESVTPTYTKSYPNGRECDGSPCLNYKATLEARSPTLG